MAERLKITPENSPETLALPTAEQAEPLRRGEEDPAKHNKAEALAEARTAVEETTKAEKQANPVEAFQAAEKAARPAQSLHVNRELKNITLNRELMAIRRRLSAPQRVLSKVIHQPVVRAVSEPLGKTVTRPSGLLGGGLVALIGTSAYLMFTRHNGTSYKYSAFLALFVGGFIVGLFLELAVYVATRPRRHAND